MARPNLDPVLFVEYFGQCNFLHMTFLAVQIDDASNPFAPSVKKPDKHRPLSRGPKSSEPGRHAPPPTRPAAAFSVKIPWRS